MDLKPVKIQDLRPEVFQVFGTRNALLTAGNREKCNTMTIGWCQLGQIWGLPVCTVLVRPERYTYGFMEEKDYFTVSVLDPSYRAVMADCGRRSGRDVDKIQANGLTLAYGAGETPYPTQAEWVLVCKKVYADDLKPECMKDGRVERFYRGDGLHRVYVGEVVEAFQK